MAKNDRLEREIEEILGKIEQFPGPESRAKRARQRALGRAAARVHAWQQHVARELSRVNLSQLMLLSFLMILFAFFFRGRFLPPTLSMWVLAGGVILFVSTFAVMVFGRRGPGAAQRWRGRPIPPARAPQASAALRLRRWWAARTRR